MSLSALLEENAPGRPTVVTVGTFDGVHNGHRKLLRYAADVARNAKRPASAVAVVFKKPPRAFFRPERTISYLCSLDTRIKLIQAEGVETVIPVEFDESIQSVTPPEFVEMLRDTLRMTDYVSGPGAVVGRDRSGDADTMRELSEEYEYNFHTVGPEIYNGEAVSSTNIRNALSSGRMGDVARMLGRRYAVDGTVAKGDGRGRTIGFPTANLEPADHDYPPALPSDGIYATWAAIDDGPRLMAATSIGVRPTFEQDGRRIVESYILDFDQDIYGKNITLEFVRRLRPELAFDQVDDLVEQMKQDVESTRELLVQDRAPSATR